jgi:pyruvate/2-oxoglutarate dehydrogenase complex dihydrolipoamide acyltransferase (E2) component
MDPENEQQELAALGAAAAVEGGESASEDAAESFEPEALPETARNGVQSAATEQIEHPEPEPEADPATTLSPAVRRLVRQYDLDITGIHGTGPSGRIRVGDVMGMLGARTDASARLEGAARSVRPERELADSDALADPKPRASTAVTPASAAHPITTVFECDLSRVMSHRKQLRQSGTDVLLTSYYLVGCAEALRTVPETGASDGDAAAWPRFGVLLASTEDELRSTLVDASAAADGSLDDRLLAFDRALRSSGQDDLGAAGLMVHHYGMSGSLLATPLPLAAGHAASVGIGRVRRAIVIKVTDGEEAPRVAAVCYVTVTFAPERISLQRANRFLAKLVRVLEQWA